MVTYWRLPGPTRFIDRVVSALRDGTHVAVVHPPVWPAGFRRELESKVHENDLWVWWPVDLAEEAQLGDGDPAGALATRLVTSPARFSSPVEALASEPACDGQVIWVTGLTSVRWQAWRHFVADYDQVVRNRDASRMLFVFDVPAALAKGDSALAGLRLHEWRSPAASHEMFMLAWNRLRDVSMTYLHRRLAIATICECAGNDEDLLSALAAGWKPPLIDVAPILLDEARRRGWDPALVKDPDWRAGTLEHWNGTERAHSCAVALLDDRAELRRRQWMAHVSVVFPFLEQERARLVAEMAPRLLLPHVTPHGTVESAHDMELSHLLHQARNLSMARSSVQWLECLVSLRHRLAHLEPLGAAQLEHPELLRRLGPQTLA